MWKSHSLNLSLKRPSQPCQAPPLPLPGQLQDRPPGSLELRLPSSIKPGQEPLMISNCALVAGHEPRIIASLSLRKKQSALVLMSARVP